MTRHKVIYLYVGVILYTCSWLCHFCWVLSVIHVYISCSNSIQ